MKHLLTTILALSFVFGQTKAFAHTDIEAETAAMFKAAPGALNLKEVKAAVVNDQLDVEVSYERLLQAQQKIAEARSQYFPYGLGTVAMLYWMNAWNVLILVELVTSLPSKIYYVQSEKNMRWAQYYSHMALRENIKNQVANLYYTMMKEEIGLQTVNLEIRLLEELMASTSERLALGLATQDEVLKIEMRLLDLREISLKFESYLAEERSAFNQMMGRDPEAVIKLAPVRPLLSEESVKMSKAQVVAAAVERAPEIPAANYRIRAAKNAKYSTQWSVLSFSGIGFGYSAKVSIARSKVNEAYRQLELAKSNIAAEAHLSYTRFERALGHYQADEVALMATADFMNADRARFDAGQVSIDRLVEAEVLYLRDFREWAISHYDALIRYDDLGRIVLGDLTNGKINSSTKTQVQ